MNVSGAFSSLHSGNVLCGQHLPHVSTGYSHVDPLGRLDGAGYVLLDSTTMVLPPTSCSTTSLLSPRFFSLSFFCCFVFLFVCWWWCWLAGGRAGPRFLCVNNSTGTSLCFSVSVCLSACLSVFLSVFMSVCLSLSNTCLSLSFSVLFFQIRPSRCCHSVLFIFHVGAMIAFLSFSL